jgi:V8-like Glu-specific endopeptidase
MAVGIIIHVSVGKEKRTEFFNEENIRIGSDEISELQIHTKLLKNQGLLLQLEWDGEAYRVINFKRGQDIKLNGSPLTRFVAINDGDVISIENASIEFSFFSLTSESALITTNREPHVAPFIEEAAVESAITEQRDDAKAFLREFSRELLREISWTTKLITLVILIGFFSGLFYLAYGFYQEYKRSIELVKLQTTKLTKLEKNIATTNEEIGELNKSNKTVLDTLSLAPNLRVDYGNGVCLIVGVYDLVDRRSGRMLRYPDPNEFKPDPYEPAPSEEGIYELPEQKGLTTSGNGTPVEYDFIVTGFHFGNGFIMTNRHVLQPWTEDELVKQLMKESKGRARIKKLVVYFPGYTTAFTMRIRKVSYKEDLAVGIVNADQNLSGIPILPLETKYKETIAVGKTVVTMGYPNGPDRLLAMLDDEEAKKFNRKYGSSRQTLINFLAQSKKIAPLTTQGLITDLDKKRVVHDAKTAEGGSGAPLFGQSGKVIGVNFGVFTENNAANMAIPISFAIELLKESGWVPKENKISGNNSDNQTAKNLSTEPPKNPGNNYQP